MGKPVFFGLDISDRSVDLVSLIRKGGKIVVDRYGKAELPPGAIDRGIIEDVETVSKVVGNLLQALYGAQKPRKFNVGIALPETQIFSKIFRLPPNLAPEMVDQAVEQEAKDTFPIDLRNAFKETVTVHRDKDGQDVYFAAVVTKVLQGYVEVARRVGMEPLFFDSEAVAVARALVRPEDPPTLIVGIGARSTMLAVTEGGGVRMVSEVAIAGNHLTEALEAKLGVPLQEAERLKRTYGFNPDAEDDRVLFLLQAPMGEIIQEARHVLDYYRKKTGRAIGKVLLTGGGSLTPFLADYVASNLPGITVIKANPLEKVHIDDSGVGEAFHTTATMHASGIGLALRVIGVMTHPQMTFLVEQPKGFQLPQLFKRLGERFTSMAPRAKKAPSEKKPHKKEEPLSVPAASEPVPVPVPAPAPTPVAAPVPAPAPAATTASDDSVLAQLSPAIEAQKELSEEAVVSASGAGSLTSIAPPTNDQLYAEQLTGQHRTGLGETDAGDLYHSEAMVSETSNAPRKSRAGLLVLVVLVLILAIAAVAGVMMFLKKNDMTDGIAGMMPWNRDGGAVVEETSVPTTPESVAVTFRLRTEDAVEAAGEDAMPVLGGRLLETDISVSGSFESTGSKPSVGGKAKGTVTIINKTSNAYTFVATTRVLSKEGVLFRLDKATPIPANGSVETAVTADVAGPAGDIAPTTFTIPGLGAAYETTVTATSDAAMTGGAGGDVGAISVDDLVNAKDALTEKGATEATADLDALRRQTEHLEVALYIDEEIAFEAPEAGTVATSFDATLSLNMKTLTVPEDKVQDLLLQAMEAALPSGSSAADFTFGSLSYRVVAFDVDKLEAEIRVEVPVLPVR